MPRLPRLLKRGGLAVLEIGQGQGKEVEALAAGQGLQVAGIKEDMAGIARCVTITHNNLS
jgi:release factor glutamine methyltransferase